MEQSWRATCHFGDGCQGITVVLKKANGKVTPVKEERVTVMEEHIKLRRRELSLQDWERYFVGDFWSLGSKLEGVLLLPFLGEIFGRGIRFAWGASLRGGGSVGCYLQRWDIFWIVGFSWRGRHLRGGVTEHFFRRDSLRKGKDWGEESLSLKGEATKLKRWRGRLWEGKTRRRRQERYDYHGSFYFLYQYIVSFLFSWYFM